MTRSSYTRTSTARNLFGGTSAALLTAISAIGLALATTNVHADETPPHTVVRYDDLNLARAQDANELHQRLQRAARSVCSDFNGRDLAMVAQRRACYEQALNAAVADVNSATLTAVHRAAGYDRVAQRPGTATSGS